jgi:hypothetical protein
LLYKIPKWTKNSGILLAFLIIPPRHVRPCMLLQKKMYCQNRLQLQEYPCTGIPWSLELLLIYNT